MLVLCEMKEVTTEKGMLGKSIITVIIAHDVIRFIQLK